MANTPAPVAVPAPRAPVAATRPPARWQDAPATPGTWRWGREGARSVARFAGGELVLACDPASRTVSLLRRGPAGEHVPLTVITTAQTRPLSAEPMAGDPGYLGVTFAARDPLLDAMAFSRGRFAIDMAGAAPLFVPSWTEVSRVIEDCR